MDDGPGAVLRPWTIKAMPEAISTRAVAAARRRQEPVAELVARALVRELDQPQPSIPSGGNLDERLERLARMASLLTMPGQKRPPKLTAELRRVVLAHVLALSRHKELFQEQIKAVGSDATEQTAQESEG